ncbi:MAG: L-2-amino-thiazoline-4-carboxylic acid hydrolase [Deltaproteobacteria bacterium]|nr:L-2-amino-thiazoline-4-carboxylic acid hydrolase [Deltaproteobacteria bacterium]
MRFARRFLLVALAALAILLAVRWWSRRRMPRIGHWQKILAQSRGELEAALLAARVDARYGKLEAERPRFSRFVLDVHLTQLLLPTLALYQVLREDGGTEEEALQETERVFLTDLGRTGWVIGAIARVPGFFGAFRRTARFLLPLAFPYEGWDTEWVETSDGCVAYDIVACPYLEVLKANGAPELTPVFCKWDDIAFGGMPGISWERTGTLGRGDARCDFRWRRVQPGDDGA